MQPCGSLSSLFLILSVIVTIKSFKWVPCGGTTGFPEVLQRDFLYVCNYTLVLSVYA